MSNGWYNVLMSLCLPILLGEPCTCWPGRVTQTRHLKSSLSLLNDYWYTIVLLLGRSSLISYAIVCCFWLHFRVYIISTRQLLTILYHKQQKEVIILQGSCKQHTYITSNKLASARSIFEQNIQKNKEAGCHQSILGQNHKPVSSSSSSRKVTRRLLASQALSDRLH